jgi:thiol-disulfide isomerase/thioredoxin
MKMSRGFVLVVVVILIAGVIVYLDRMKVHPAATAASANDSSVATSTHSAVYAQNSVQYPSAKELVSPDGYINTGGQPITLNSLVGNHVVLLDFWTYSCINCLRTVPYLEAWYNKYKAYGLVIIGVHTPEFDFEKVMANVQAAVLKNGITYPVVLDSEYQTWDAYNNEYWPSEYLIDQDGLVRENNIGEGNYQETETNIQTLLKELAKSKGEDPSKIPTGFVNITSDIETNSPETYFDDQRNEYLGNGTQGVAGTQTFTAPTLSAVTLNTLYLGGTWDIEDQFAQNTTAASIIYQYDAKDMYFVASSSQESGTQAQVLLDGKPIPTTMRGADVDANGMVNITGPRLYKLIEGSDQGQHTLQIIVPNPGLEAFTFTFG